MAISEATKRNPVYKEALGLMEAPKVKAIKKWHKEKLAYSKENYAPYVSAGMFDTYKTALEKYAKALESSYTTYQGASPAKKETILTHLINQDRRELANSIKIMDERRRERVRTAPPTSISTPKKSGWWKHALAYGTLIAALTGLWLKGNKNNSSEGDNSSTRMEQRMSALEKRLAGGVEQRGNTFAARDPISIMKKQIELEKYRLELAKLQRYKAEENARIAEIANDRLRDDASAENYVIEKKYESQLRGYRAAQEGIYTGWYGQEKAQELERSRNSTIRDNSGTMRKVRNDYWNR